MAWMRLRIASGETPSLSMHFFKRPPLLFPFGLPCFGRGASALGRCPQLLHPPLLRLNSRLGRLRLSRHRTRLGRLQLGA